VKSHYQNSLSFFGKTRIVLVLLGVIPFLLVIYLFVYQRIEITDMIVLFAALALFSILSGFSLLRRSADHIIRLSMETANIERGERFEPIIVRGDQELHDIAKHFNSVIAKLYEAQRDVKEQSVQLMLYARDISQSYKKTKEEVELRGRLSRYVGENLVEKLMQSKDDIVFENERKELTILFADIRSFSTIAEKLAAEVVVSMLNQFFNIMVDIIFRNNGVLDKFVGDQLMAVFGLVPPTDHHSFDAILAAIAMQTATREWMMERAKEGKATFEVGIGINSGSAIVGNVGSENRMDYTAIGDSVNTAARLQQIAKGSEIIIGEETYRQTRNHFQVRKKGKLQVKNKSEPVMCYKVIW
jgi:adenylate cyclase